MGTQRDQLLDYAAASTPSQRPSRLQVTAWATLLLAAAVVALLVGFIGTSVIRMFLRGD